MFTCLRVCSAGSPIPILINASCQGSVPKGVAQGSCIVKLLSGAEHSPVQSTKLQAHNHILITQKKQCVLFSLLPKIHIENLQKHNRLPSTMVEQQIQYKKLPFSFQAFLFFLKLNIDLFLRISLRLEHDKSVMMLSLLAVSPSLLPSFRTLYSGS